MFCKKYRYREVFITAAVTRSNYAANSILTSTALNADFNQILTRINSFPGDLITAATIPYTALATGATAKLTLRTITTTDTAAVTDDLIICDTAAGSYTLTLPTAVGISGKIYRIMKSTSDANILTIDGATTETINGTLTKKLSYIYDEIMIISNNANWLVLHDTSSSYVRMSLGNGYGSSSTIIRKYTNTLANVGTAITLDNSATLGATFTINEKGVYAIAMTEVTNSSFHAGISLNSNQLTTGITSITAAHCLAVSQITTNNEATITWVGVLASGDVIRPHVSAAEAAGSTVEAKFAITKLR